MLQSRTGCFLPASIAGFHGSRRRRLCPIRASDEGNVGERVKRFASKLQSQLPLVGLWSKLTTPSGGVGLEDLSYGEFCRSVYDKSNINDPFTEACYDLETDKGKEADRRYLLFSLWVTKYGVGVVPDKDIVMACTRLRVTLDLEAEIDRFESLRDFAVKKYKYLEKPQQNVNQLLEVLVDSLCRLVYGKTEGQDVSDSQQSLIIALILAEVPEATEDMCKAVLKNRRDRKIRYI